MSNIDPSAIIDDEAEIHSSSKISAYTVIRGKVKINKNCVIGSHTIIGAKPSTSLFQKLENSIVIDEHCNIGDGVIIQGGCTQTTKIGKNTEINHNCSIGHGVSIGENCFIGLNNSISGKSVIGNNVVTGPGCTFNHLSEVGNNVRVGIGSLVLHRIDNNLVVIGRPAKDINLEKKNNKKLRQLLNDDQKSKPITSPLGKYKFLRNILRPIYSILPNILKKYISIYLDNKRNK